MNHLAVLKDKLVSVAETGVSLVTQKNDFRVTPILKQGYIVGVEATNIPAYPFLSIDVFVAVISLLELSPENFAVNGNVYNYKLGDPGLPLNSIEGHVAKVVYNYKKGETVYKRITPIVKILE